MDAQDMAMKDPKDWLTGDRNSSSSQKKYVQPTQEEFEEFIVQLEDMYGIKFGVVDAPNTKELVYETKGILPDHSDVSLRIFSTIEERSGKARSKGSDAIRTVIWSNRKNRPIGGRTKTLRIKTWRKNLRKKVESLLNETSQYVNPCDECGSWLVEREGEYGKFLGCLTYPDCKNTQQIKDE